MRPFTVIACDQRSPQWLAARCGRLTGSRAEDAFRTTKTGAWSAERKNLKMQLVLERLTGQPQERHVGGYQVRDGIAREPAARFAYECTTGAIVRQCGFVSDTELPIGCSPDGVLEAFEGLVSIKCGIAATHLANVMNVIALRKATAALHDQFAVFTGVAVALADPPVGESLIVPVDHLFQIRHELYCTGAAWCDYVSYDGSFPPTLQIAIVRVAREDVALDQYEPLVSAFLAEVDAEYARVLELAS